MDVDPPLPVKKAKIEPLIVKQEIETIIVKKRKAPVEDSKPKEVIKRKKVLNTQKEEKQTKKRLSSLRNKNIYQEADSDSDKACSPVKEEPVEAKSSSKKIIESSDEENAVMEDVENQKPDEED